MMETHYYESRIAPRRLADELRLWVPLVLSILSTMLAIGLVYGKLGGRLDLIEYRLMQIERRLP